MRATAGSSLSVFGLPFTLFTSRAFTRRTSSPADLRCSMTGSQNTPVASMATVVTFFSLSQAASSRR